jgi:hypothetical protein
MDLKSIVKRTARLIAVVVLGVALVAPAAGAEEASPAKWTSPSATQTQEAARACVPGPIRKLLQTRPAELAELQRALATGVSVVTGAATTVDGASMRQSSGAVGDNQQEALCRLIGSVEPASFLGPATPMGVSVVTGPAVAATGHTGDARADEEQDIFAMVAGPVVGLRELEAGTVQDKLRKMAEQGKFKELAELQSNPLDPGATPGGGQLSEP